MQLTTTGGFYEQFVIKSDKYDVALQECIESTVAKLRANETSAGRPGMLLGKILSPRRQRIHRTNARNSHATPAQDRDHGHEVHCMDINPNAPVLDPDCATNSVERIIHGDITVMGDVVEALVAAKPDRCCINLAYCWSSAPPRPTPIRRSRSTSSAWTTASRPPAWRRLLDIRRVVYASSLAVYGPQRLADGNQSACGDKGHGHRGRYSASASTVGMSTHVSKRFNEHQADWYKPRLRTWPSPASDRPTSPDPTRCAAP